MKKRRSRIDPRDLLVMLAGSLWLALQGASAAPLDLEDPTPRWIEVRFEISPEDDPGRLDRNWGALLPAYLEPGGNGELRRIEVPAPAIEGHLRRIGTEVIPGTFSPFVWTLDARTGHVTQASMTGRVQQPMSLGLVETTVSVKIRVEMTTQQPGGFRPRSEFMGQSTYGFCQGAREASDCTLVPSHPLDLRDGYVNAIGSIRAEIPLARYRAFSPLGEARFSEQRRPGQEAVVSRPLGRDAVCSVSFGGSC